jgi:hypothetical protein
MFLGIRSISGFGRFIRGFHDVTITIPAAANHILPVARCVKRSAAGNIRVSKSLVSVKTTEVRKWIEAVNAKLIHHPWYGWSY